MPVQRLKANPRVEADQGRIALQRGPLVYCLEAVDNGGQVRNLVLPPGARLHAEDQPGVLGGVTVIRGEALAVHHAEWPDGLYRPADRLPGVTPVGFTAIPYFANANRQPGEMTVWIAESAEVATPLPRPSLAASARASGSHCGSGDTLAALNDQIEPTASDDQKIPRFTWWDHRGTREWPSSRCSPLICDIAR
jgi:hypothetical protein